MRAGRNRQGLRWLLFIALVAAVPQRAPAPLIFRPGEGWTYEPYGGEGQWRMTRAKDQLEAAQAAFDKQAYDLALKAAKRVVKVWPYSDYAPQAQYLVGRCYEALGEDEKAFAQYQFALEKYPSLNSYEDILRRQYEIANRFLAGQWIKLWGVIPFFPSMDKTVEMYNKIVKNGAYSDIAPQAQLGIGAARENQSDYTAAVKAYETAADRYYDRPKVAADAVYRTGLAYGKLAQKAEYDQSAAGQAISTFTDFVALFPNDSRVPEAQKKMGVLKTEQARGCFEVANFYEKHQKWTGAVVYYNEVLLLDPNSQYAQTARRRIEELKPRTQDHAPTPAPNQNQPANPDQKPPP